MRPLTLLCASGLAREVLAVVVAEQPGRPVQLLDDDPGTWGSTTAGAMVTGGLEEARHEQSGELLVCAGTGAVRREIVHRLAGLGVDRERYGRLVHPRADVAPGCSVGRGSILLAHVVLTADVHAGDHVVAMPQVTLTHDDVVDDFATLCAGVSLGGSVHVGEGAYLGMNSSVRQGLHVGAGAVLGMGAALVGDLPAGEQWTGVPASRLVRRHDRAGV